MVYMLSESAVLEVGVAVVCDPYKCVNLIEEIPVSQVFWLRFVVSFNGIS